MRPSAMNVRWPGVEDADEHHAPEVYAYGGDGDFDEPLGIGERHDEGLGKEQDEPACGGGKTEGKGQDEEKGLLHAFGFARAVVVAHDGHGALAQAVRWQAQQLLDAEHDGHGADVIVVAVLLHPGIHDQGDDAVRHLDEERGKADRMTGTSSLRSSRRYCLRKCKTVRLPKKKAKIQTALDGLAANRGERRAFAAHIEAVDEYRIEDNVEGRPDEDGHHARLGKAWQEI